MKEYISSYRGLIFFFVGAVHVFFATGVQSAEQAGAETEQKGRPPGATNRNDGSIEQERSTTPAALAGLPQSASSLAEKQGVDSYMEGPRKYVSKVFSEGSNTQVRVFVNKVWPSGSPSETYKYYDVPLACAPDLVYPQLMSLGQIVKGDRLVSSAFDFARLPAHLHETEAVDATQEYIHQEPERKICTRYFTPDQVTELKQMVDRFFVAEVQVDEFPVTSFVGLKLDKETVKIYQDMEKQQAKEAEAGGSARYTADRMWGEYHADLFAANTGADPSTGNKRVEDGIGVATSKEEGDKDGSHFRYFLITRFEFIITHTGGDVRQVKLSQPQLSDMTDITEMPKDGSYLKADFSVTVSWYPHIANYPETREQAIDTQIEENDYHLWHDLDPDVDNEAKQAKNWDWLHLPDAPRFQMKVHWLGIFNGLAVMLSIFTFVVYYLINHVKEDLREFGLPVATTSKYAPVEAPQTSGWKLVHADVFRAPPARLWFCASIGAGTQLAIMAGFTILCGCVEHFHQRGSVVQTMAYAYLVSSICGGYVSGNWYQKLGGQTWTLNMFVTCLTFALPCFLVWAVCNTIAIAYQSTAAFPFGYILLLFFLYFFVTVPLTLIGCALGKQIALRDLRRNEQAAGSYFPCRTNKLERQIPGAEAGTLLSGGLMLNVTQCFTTSFLPFVSIYVELHYIFDSMWGPARYTVYGILLVSVLLTVINSCLLSLFFLYLQLKREDWRWWWQSFLSGASFVFCFLLYCFYFFFRLGHMDSFLQSSFFFLYSFLVAYGLFLMMGALTFLASATFMRYLYSHVKGD
ncbi:unnamed protein product [Amoebophrya sp. A120]|nr:unnamed protein product [Amoebophrya sp. A120]|eukprot:GSA120T00006561001.1